MSAVHEGTLPAHDQGTWLARLRDVATSLSAATGLDAVAAAIVTEGCAALGANSGMVAVLSDDRSLLRALRMVGLPTALFGADGTLPIDAPIGLAEAVRRRQPIVVASFEERLARCPRLAPLASEGGHGAAAAVPLLAGERVIGGLMLGFAADRKLSDDDLAFLHTLGALCAQALERARLFDAEHRQRVNAERATERLRALQEVTDTALAHAPLEALLARVLRKVRDVLAADTAVILLPAADRHLRVRAAIGLEEEVAREVRVPIGQGVAGTIAATRKPLIVDDLRTVHVVSTYLREGVRSLLGVPLLVEGRLVGVLHVGKRVAHHFTSDDLDLLQRAADRIALALEDVRLYEDVAERERRFRATFEQAAVGIAHVGLDGRWLRVNARLCEIVGYSRDELLARTFQEITYPEDLHADLGYMDQMLAGAIATYSMDKRYIQRDGHVVWIRLTASLVRDAAGAPDYFIGVVEDIDSRVAAEQEVRLLNASLEQRVEDRTSRLREANEMLEAFTYTVSHDLRAPLRAMQGFAVALQEDYADVLDDEGQEFTRQIVAASSRMDALITDLLAYSRLERAELQPGVVDLTRVVADALGRVRADVAASRATIVVAEPLPRVCGHYATLVQVVTNLLSNAVKFVLPGATPQVRVTAEEHDGWARVWVEDSGIGIAPEHRARVFKVFERLHGVEAYPGTGIGLAIVAKGMERMGGRSGMEARAGTGSRFWIELPVAGVG